MLINGWKLRPNHETFAPNVEYGGNLNMFSLKIHHGGVFTRKPVLTYADADIGYVDNIDADEFSVIEIKLMVEEMGYPKNQIMFYHFCIPGMSVNDGIRSLGTDHDVMELLSYDGNNCIYPVAYAIVEAETTASWKWFLECLGGDLDLQSNSNFSFISDRQKGIIPAIKMVFPSAEHRYCLRHIHENMRGKWGGVELKIFLWKIASATTVQKFEKYMEEMKKKNLDLHKWLLGIQEKENWARAFQTGRAKCDMLLNNVCEVFNRQLVDGRDKPIITHLEFIRQYIMKRIGNVNKMITKCEGPLTFAATKAFSLIKDEASQLNVLWNGNKKYEVSGNFNDRYVVDVGAMTCTCRKCELTGMPCKHAVAVNNDMHTNSLVVDIPELWVDKVYWLDTWKKVYKNTVDPINGMWPSSNCTTSLLPPKHHKQIGRPSKARKRSAEELSQNLTRNGKMTKVGKLMTCGRCGGKGHNRKGCSEPIQKKN